VSAPGLPERWLTLIDADDELEALTLEIEEMRKEWFLGCRVLKLHRLFRI
jgi:hypothetical protein